MKNILKKIIIIGILFSGFTAMASWNPPFNTPPTTNIGTPITKLPNAQQKDGGLSVGSLSSYGNSVFYQQVFIQGGISSLGNEISFGRDDIPDHQAEVMVSGNIKTSGKIIINGAVSGIGCITNGTGSIYSIGYATSSC